MVGKFSDVQKRILEITWTTGSYEKENHKLLSKITKLAEKQVTRWFVDRRIRAQRKGEAIPKRGLGQRPGYPLNAHAKRKPGKFTDMQREVLEIAWGQNVYKQGRIDAKNCAFLANVTGLLEKQVKRWGVDRRIREQRKRGGGSQKRTATRAQLDIPHNTNIYSEPRARSKRQRRKPKHYGEAASRWDLEDEFGRSASPDVQPPIMSRVISQEEWEPPALESGEDDAEHNGDEHGLGDDGYAPIPVKQEQAVAGRPPGDTPPEPLTEVQAAMLRNAVALLADEAKWPLVAGLSGTTVAQIRAFVRGLG